MSRHQNLQIEIFNSPSEAPDYNKEEHSRKTAFLTKAVIVRKGTVYGHDTVDLQFEDEAGNKYVALVSGFLLKSVADVTNTGGNNG